MVTVWILTSLGSTTAKCVLHSSSASDIWKNLEDRFRQSSTTQLSSIQQDLAKSSQENDDITVFLHKDEGFAG